MCLHTKSSGKALYLNLDSTLWERVTRCEEAYQDCLDIKGEGIQIREVYIKTLPCCHRHVFYLKQTWETQEKHDKVV